MFFENPYYLFFILFIPAYFFFTEWLEKYKKEKLSLLGNQKWIGTLLQIASQKNIFSQKIFFSAAILFFSIALANPKWGEKSEELNVKQSDVVLAMDISESMLCDDVKPNRLERAKQFAKQLVQNIKAERIGIIVFAGSAYIQMPLTTDYNAASMFIQSASTDLAASQGTAIGEAIKAAQELRGDNKNPCSLVIITDGETHDDDALSYAEDAKKQDIVTFIAGIGTKEGGYIPIQTGGYQLTKKDENGNPIRTKMNPDVLSALAKAGGGDFSDVSLSRDMSNWKNKLSSNANETSKRVSYRNKESHYQVFLLLAFIFLLLAYFFPFLKK